MTYRTRNAHEVAIIVDHIGAFLVVVRVTVVVRVARRVVSHPVEWAVAVNAVADLLVRRGAEGRGVGFLQSVDGTQLAVSVLVGACCIVGSFMMVLEDTRVIKTIDDVDARQCPSMSAVTRSPAGGLLVVAWRVTSPSGLHRILELPVEVGRWKGRGPLVSKGASRWRWRQESLVWVVTLHLMPHAVWGRRIGWIRSHRV